MEEGRLRNFTHEVEDSTHIIEVELTRGGVKRSVQGVGEDYATAWGKMAGTLKRIRNGRHDRPIPAEPPEKKVYPPR